MASKTLQDASKTPSDASETTKITAKTLLRLPQTSEEISKRLPNAQGHLHDASKAAQAAPRSLQGAQGRFQHTSKISQTRQETSRRLQDAQNHFQDVSTTASCAPKKPPDASGAPQPRAPLRSS